MIYTLYIFQLPTRIEHSELYLIQSPTYTLLCQCKPNLPPMSRPILPQRACIQYVKGSEMTLLPKSRTRVAHHSALLSICAHLFVNKTQQNTQKTPNYRVTMGIQCKPPLFLENDDGSSDDPKSDDHLFNLSDKKITSQKRNMGILKEFKENMK